VRLLRGTRRQLKRKLLTTLKLVGIHSNTQLPPPKPHNEPLGALEEKERSNSKNMIVIPEREAKLTLAIQQEGEETARVAAC
jgi:hypothetical protein